MQRFRKVRKVGTIVQIRWSLFFVVLDEFLPLVKNVIGCESEMIVQCITLPGRAEHVVHPDLGVRKSMPTGRRGRFNRQRRDVPGQHRFLVFLRLFQKQILTGHANDAAKWDSPIANPTAFEMPCPNGPVQTSTPLVTKHSG